MKINRLVLYNFNSFEGYNEFDFSKTKDKKNIILIGGKNGAGKTTLFTAIKIALYGPLAYGYSGVNPYYISKLKDCINLKTFQTDKVETKVEIDISLKVEREEHEYRIVREWDYSKQKLIENFCIYCDGKKLEDQEISYFQNYLNGLVPPDLFEFFLFDGEEVGSIFSTAAYNSYVKNAVYTLCGLDIFEIIRKYTKGYVGRASSSEDSELYDSYDELKQSVEDAEKRRNELEKKLIELKEEEERIDVEIADLENSFKKAGGISPKEKQKLSEEFSKAEQTKAEASAEIKMFVEGLMPFYILKDFTEKVSTQIELEEEGEIYNYIQERLSKKDVKNLFPNEIADEKIDEIVDAIIGKFKPKGYKKSSKTLHDLSREETNRVNALLTSIEGFDKEKLVCLIQQKQAASDKTSRINKKLKSAMSEDDVLKYSENENILIQKKADLSKEYYEKTSELEKLNDEIDELANKRDKVHQLLLDRTKDNHILELSNSIESMMSELLSDKSMELKQKLEELIVQNLQRIYRKNNLITHIEIEEDFQFNLYQNENYSSAELAYLMQNLGKENFAMAVGKFGLQKLMERYKVSSVNDLQIAISFDSSEKIESFKNIDLSRLSKGERQIFILSLYWAIIELSDKKIPFVIDTPYARIDASHRKEISKKFFPNISDQVIILSTDEEINEEYYKIIKPYIAKEYLLINDANQNKTTIENKYFYED